MFNVDVITLLGLRFS